MSIFALMTIATTLRIGRWCRLLRYLAVVAVVASAAASPAGAADETSKSPMPSRVVAPAKEASQPAPQKTELAPKAYSDHGNLFCNGIRVQDEIELVNTRNVCGCCDPEAFRNRITVENYAVCDAAGSRRWQRSDLESFFAFNPEVPTVIFVHGNQISPWDAKNEGVAVYRRVILHGSDTPPIRFVIFSWPSARINGNLLNDIRVKAARTGPAGVQLAWLVDQMSPETPVSLAGFSFGARIITGGLHVLGGGSLGGSMSLAKRQHPNRSPTNVFMMASALHAHWLGDGQYHGLAMTQVSRMCLINNCDDPAMKYYDFIEPGFGGPQALGLCGPTRISAENASKIFKRDVSCSVGNVHDLMRYVCAPGDASLFWDYTVGSAAIEVKSGD